MAKKVHTLTRLPNFQGRDPFHEILPGDAASGRLVWHLKVPESVALPSFRVLVWGYQDDGLGARYSTQTQLGIFDWNADPNSPEVRCSESWFYRTCRWTLLKSSFSSNWIRPLEVSCQLVRGSSTRRS